jgi:hypothetical protein
MPLHLLTEDDYRGASPGAVVTDGQMAHTHIALLDVESGAKPARCYVKLYPDMSGGREHRGLVNEMVGHVVASAMGAPVPPKAGLITLHGSQLSRLPSWASKHSELVGWWVQDMVSPSLKAFYEIDEKSITLDVVLRRLEQVRQELADSDYANLVIAFDDLIANVDRNLGNLLRVKKGHYIFIDHGLCLTSDNWERGDLDPAPVYINKINDLLDGGSQFLPFKHATVKAHEQLSANIDQAMRALLKWLPYAVDAEDSAAIERFIRHRANPGGFTKRMEMFI